MTDAWSDIPFLLAEASSLVTGLGPWLALAIGLIFSAGIVDALLLHGRSGGGSAASGGGGASGAGGKAASAWGGREWDRQKRNKRLAAALDAEMERSAVSRMADDGSSDRTEAALSGRSDLLSPVESTYHGDYGPGYDYSRSYDEGRRRSSSRSRGRR